MVDLRFSAGAAVLTLLTTLSAAGVPSRAVSDTTDLNCPGGTETVMATSDRAGSRYVIRCEAAPVSAAPIEEGAALPPETRVLQKHIYQQRRNALSFALPEGYRPVWTDGRLNPQRAERSLAPAQPRAPLVPKGYRQAWSDDRLNGARGQQTVSGETASARIWSGTLPRRLKPAELEVPVLRVELR